MESDTTQITLRIKPDHDGFTATVVGPRAGVSNLGLVQRFGATRYEAADAVLRKLFAVEKEGVA